MIQRARMLATLRRTSTIAVAVLLLLCSFALLLRGGYRTQFDLGLAERGSIPSFNPLFWLGLPAVRLIEWLGPQGPPGTNTNPTVDVHWFWQLGFLGTSVAVGLALVLLTWHRRPGQLARDIAFIAVLLVVLGLSVVNFMYHDSLMRVEAQAILDLVLVLFVIVAILRLLRLRPKSLFGVVALFLGVFLLALEAVILPALYGLSFLLLRQGAPELQVGYVSVATGLASLVLTWLTYRRGAPQEKDKKVIGP